jgi:hypothetical protein
MHESGRGKEVGTRLLLSRVIRDWDSGVPTSILPQLYTLHMINASTTTIIT